MTDNGKIGLGALTALVFSSMVGAGIFSLPQNMAEVAGVDAIITGWLITGVGILLLAGCFLHLSRLVPEMDGGIYTYARAGFGDLFGFLSAWGYWLCATIGVVGYLVVAFAAIGAFTDSPEQIWFGDGNTLAAFVGESVILWLVHALVLRGVKQAALINLLGTLAKSLPLLLFIALAYWYFDPQIFATNRTTQSLPTPFMEQVKNTMLITLWVFTGIEGAIILSVRARKRHDIGKATCLGVIFALVLYVAITLLSLGIMVRPDVAALPNPSMSGLMAHMTGMPGKVIMSCGLIISVLASYLSWILYSAEVPCTAAEYGAFPQVFRVKNRHGTSQASLLMTSITVQLCLVLILWTGKSYNTLVLISTSMILIPYFLVAAYLVKLAYQTQASLAIKLTGIGASIYGLWLIYAAGIESLLLSTTLYIPGLLIYFTTRKRQTRTYAS
ncbi:basic amino acid/polyamine antiporter [Vibrio mangrovi]|uniref:Basic amino acid/polyamine antiporter n=1 Tax=Vibrio mangrovi TaxID=474394 RepID=A0A1Y6IZ69_9VIBR|nr:basic amino acid/polyamine antiporter [Vibrio mangrovi]MDW6005310.1 basic amino acid/polyamine antiporter [Vibrio mangrovi]SMS02936.1 Putative arginine/ornithine antiporter [Vibrio mangrovi]